MTIARQWLERSYFHNRVEDYLLALLMFIAALAALWIFRRIALPRVKKWAARTANPLDDFLLAAFEKAFIPIFYFGAFYVSVRNLNLGAGLEKTFSGIEAFIVTFMGTRFLLQTLEFVLTEYWGRTQENPEQFRRHTKSLMPILTVIAWSLSTVFLLDNLGFKVSAIMAGLGVGGVAVALASQAVLGDMFGYVAIMMDRPFELDDFIVVGDFMGSVEHVGIKTTRLRSLGGEMLVLSNKDLTDSRVRNFKRMQLRRIVFSLSLTYDTSVEKMKKAVALVQDIVRKTPDTRLDRAHFSAYGESGLGIEAVYFVLSADYNLYMDRQQAIYLAIKDAFEKEAIQFAFPTRTLVMAGPNVKPAI